MRTFTSYTFLLTLVTAAVQVLGAVPNNGTYALRNVATGTFLNILGGNSAEKTPLVGYHDDNGAYMKWEYVRKGDDLVTLWNTGTRTFADAPHESAGALVIGSRKPGIFEIIDLIKNKQHVYQLVLTDLNLALRLPDHADDSRVTLQSWSKNDPNQQWVFVSK